MFLGDLLYLGCPPPAPNTHFPPRVKFCGFDGPDSLEGSARAVVALLAASWCVGVAVQVWEITS